MDVTQLNTLALDLVARDFTGKHVPTNGGPTMTSRALAIIHLAARDAYVKARKNWPGPAPAPILAILPPPPPSVNSQAEALAAAVAAGVRAAELLYPDSSTYIAEQSKKMNYGVNAEAAFYGYEVGHAWFEHRRGDGSSLPQADYIYSNDAGRHRPDPLAPAQATLGRNWGAVKPFLLGNVETDASLRPPHALGSAAYKSEFDEVYECGRNNTPLRSPAFRDKAIKGIFWGYHGANKLGTPPRLYNQVVVATNEFKAMDDFQKLNALAAINAAMADAGIAAWYWKYRYDRWRPVVGIRESAAGWGPTGKGDGTNNKAPDPFWLPLGAPASNQIDKNNFTPNFPAYPSGHSTFGSACFETFAALAGKPPKDINVTFVSDEFNGTTTDNRGTTRPRYEASFTLAKAIEDNGESRIFLGVHWRDDAVGGQSVGNQVACAAIKKFGGTAPAGLCPAAK